MLTRIVADRVYDFSHVVGGRQVTGMLNLTVGRDDNVFVLLRRPNSSNVTKLSIGTMPGDEEIQTQFGSTGEGGSDFRWPAHLALDSDENVYVTDEWLHRVLVFDTDGEFLRSFGEQGDEPGQFNRPSGITIDGNDDVYVSDALNHRIQKLDKFGSPLYSFGQRGDGDGEFNAPWGLTTDSDGCVYVADHKNHRIQKFDADGEFVFSLGEHGDGEAQFDHPTDVAVDPDGDIYVCDWVNNRVQAYDADRNYITTFTGDAQELSKWQHEYVLSNPDVYKARRRVYSLEPEWRFALPMAVEFDPVKSRLLVVDPQRWRIQIYNKLDNYDDPQFNI